MPTVKQILAAKSAGVRTIEATHTVYAAVTLLAAYEIGALVVVEGSRAVGIFSERDYAPLITVLPDQPMEDCMQLMTERHIRHLPVMDGEELVGMVTIGDVVMHTIRQQQSTIEQLEGYIIGKY